MPAKKGRRMPTGGLVGRPTKAVKRAKAAAATTARSLYKLQEQLGILKTQLHQDMAVVQARKKAVGAAEVAFARKESAAERAAQKSGRRRRSGNEIEFKRWHRVHR